MPSPRPLPRDVPTPLHNTLHTTFPGSGASLPIHLIFVSSLHHFIVSSFNIPTQSSPGTQTPA